MFKFARKVAADLRKNKLSHGFGLAATSASAFAADGSIDTTTMLAGIAAGLAAALVISIAMTSAKISVRASKLPRTGA